ncbi:MAG: S8 family peptidase [Thermomicrobiales bacterium]
MDERAVLPGTTGRSLIVMREGTVRATVEAVSNVAGMTVVSASELDAPANPHPEGADAVVFAELGVMVAEAPPDQLAAVGAMAASGEGGVLAVEPERIVYAMAAGWPGEALPGAVGDYLRGYRDAVNHLAERLLLPEETPPPDETELTWGLQATNVAASQYTGRGVRVAVLDTGLDLDHPDFAGRAITAESFVAGEEVQDGHGHGTHVIGTACGPQQPGVLPRYGVASEAEIFAGKVLNNRGSGTDGEILAGIQWAMQNGCAIVSMSLGATVLPGDPYSTVFELAAQRALARGTLIVAAAGNDSARPASIQPVSHPANCPSIMAVGALDPELLVASFSNGGINPEGGDLDIAAPGVDVRSSWPRPILYRTINGTSMATPHVAGIAGLFAEANPATRGRDLWDLVVRGVRSLPAPPRDVGAGLVQAPT